MDDGFELMTERDGNINGRLGLGSKSTWLSLEIDHNFDSVRVRLSLYDWL